jgi:ribosomal protein S19
VGVYNGKKIIFFSVKKAMSGKKFGEFAVTKVLGPQVINKKKKKKIKTLIERRERDSNPRYK